MLILDKDRGGRAAKMEFGGMPSLCLGFLWILNVAREGITLRFIVPA